MHLVQRVGPALPCGALLELSSLPLATVGGSVWPMSSALSQHLLQPRRRRLLQQAEAVVELGSGTGALGLFLAGLGARCTLTEHRPPRSAVEPGSYTPDGQLELPSGSSDALLELLRRNVEANEHLCPHTPTVMELDWCCREQAQRVRECSPSRAGYPVLVGSDLTYNTAVLPSLAETVAQLLLPGGVALIAHQPRVFTESGRDCQLEQFRIALAPAGLSMTIGELPVVPDEHPKSAGRGQLLQLSHTGYRSQMSFE